MPRVTRRLALAAVVAGAIAAAVVLASDGVPEVGSPQATPTTERVRLEVIARIPARRAPQAVAATGDAVWATVAGSARLLKIDAGSNREIARIGFRSVPAGVAVAGGAVWVGFVEGAEILRLDGDDPRAGAESIAVGQTPQALAVAEDGNGVWVAALNEPAVALVELGGGEVADDIDLEGRFPAAVAAGFGRVWVPDVVGNVLLEIDPSGAIRREVRVGSSPTSVAAGEGAVWVGNFDSGTVSRYDPDAGRVTGGARLGGPVGGLAVGGGYVWATEQRRGRVVAIDPQTTEVAGAVEVGRVPQGIAVGPDGTVWVAVQGDDELVRIAVRPASR